MQLRMGSPLFSSLSLDRSAAFDTIDHTILFNRLTSSFSITGSSLNWLKSYLFNGPFSVTSGSSSSCPLFPPHRWSSILVIFTIHLYTSSRHLRSASLNPLSQLRIKITLASRGFRHSGLSLWNSLPHHLRSIDSYTVFKSNLKTRLFSGAANLALTISTRFWFDIII